MSHETKEPTAGTVGSIEGSGERTTRRAYTINGWRRFQHYTKRSPPWIKLQRSLLDDEGFACLPVESRALAPMLWLLASETDDGSLPELEKIAWRLRMGDKELTNAFDPLTRAGFVARVQGASAVHAPREQEARLEGEERRGREEAEKSETPAHAREGKLLDEIACPNCSRAGHLSNSLGRNGHPPGFWCRRPGGCGMNFGLDSAAIVSQMTPGARKALESMAPKPEAADPVADGFKRIQERGMVLQREVGNEA